jgi:AcrR family transcriptional regulator
VATQGREGIFFSTPAVLPRGRHGLPRDQVVAAQRERLMAAMTVLMADLGYEHVRVGDVASEAGVSRAAFYECFPDKEACAFAAYDRFIEVLLGRVAAALDPTKDVEDYVVTLLEGYLGTLEDDPVVGRAFQLEMDAVGAVARRRRREALDPFAEVIRRHHELLSADDPTLKPLPRLAYRGIVYGVRQIASDALDGHDEPDLRSLIPDLTCWILAAFRGRAAERS